MCYSSLFHSRKNATGNQSRHKSMKVKITLKEKHSTFDNPWQSLIAKKNYSITSNNYKVVEVHSLIRTSSRAHPWAEGEKARQKRRHEKPSKGIQPHSSSDQKLTLAYSWTTSTDEHHQAHQFDHINPTLGTWTTAESATSSSGHDTIHSSKDVCLHWSVYLLNFVQFTYEPVFLSWHMNGHS